MATDDPPGTERGLPQSLTTLSPVRPERLGALRQRLRFVAYAPGVGRPLLELGTVQYARWVVFSHLPAADGSGHPCRLGWSYLLFDATYDGSTQQYIQAFADVLPLRLIRLFGNCFGFESNVQKARGSDRRAVPAVAFETFLNENTLPLRPQHFWSARYATVAAKRQALEIERATRRADRRRRDPIGATQYEVQALALGPPTRRPGFWEATYEPWHRILRRGSSVNPLVLALPLDEGGWKQVEGLRLEALPRTHFARVVHMPATMQQDLGHVHPDRLERDYLLVSCDYDGTFDAYLTALLEDPDLSIHAFFACCEGYPGCDAPYEARRWIRAHRLDVQYYLSGLPPRPVQTYGDLVQDRRFIATVLSDGAEYLEDA